MSEGVMVAAVDMGYGHLRAAHALASALGVEVRDADQEPLASPPEARLWRWLRGGYTLLSRASDLPLLGPLAGWSLRALTEIPELYPSRDLSSPTWSVEALGWLIDQGFGRNLARQLKESGACLLTTFYAPAIAAAEAGVEQIVCVVTDADVNRIWVPRQPQHKAIEYCVPTTWAFRRLRAYGVPAERIHLTGFPLPLELTGGEDQGELRRWLAPRLVRLDPAGVFREQFHQDLQQVLGRLPTEEEGIPPRLTLAVGGAATQGRLVRSFLRALASSVEAGQLRLSLVAGVHPHLAERFHQWLTQLGLFPCPNGATEVLFEPSFPHYLEAFNGLLQRTDILWTKPSELTFFAAAGLALVFAPPVGDHEHFNRQWAVQRGAGLPSLPPHTAAHWLGEWLQEGVLAAAAWSGFRRLPRYGTLKILRLVHQMRQRLGANTRELSPEGERISGQIPRPLT